MKKKRIFIIKAILIVIISLIVGMGIYSWNVQTVQGRALPMPFGVGVAEVLSDSMHPTIMKGDVVVVAKQDDYHVGDVVAFQDRGMVVTHRIIGINEDGTYVTKGDWKGNSLDDKPLKKEYVFGEVVAQFSGLGGLIRFFKSPLVSFSLLIVAGFLFVFSTKKEKQEDNKDIDKIKAEIAALKGEANGDKKELTIEEIQAQIDELRRQSEEKKNKKE